MNIDILKERLKSLNIQKQEVTNRIDQAIADLNALDGALQEVNYWIDYIGKDK